MHQQEQPPPRLQITTFGRFALTLIHDGKEQDITEQVHRETGWRGPALTLLKVLLSCGPLIDSHRRSTPPHEWERHEAARDSVVAALWPEKDLSHRERLLSTTKSTFNHALRPYVGGEDTIILTNGTDKVGYALTNQGLVIDADLFELAVGEACAAEGRGENALPFWERAFALVQGEFLPQDQYNDWSQRRRSRLHAKYRLCLQRITSFYIQNGRISEAVGLLHPYVFDHLTDQDALSCLLPLLAQQGRYEEAWMMYHQVKEALAEEERRPSSALVALIRRIRQEQHTAMGHAALALMPAHVFTEVPPEQATSLFVVSYGQTLLHNDYREFVENKPAIWYDSLNGEVIGIVTTHQQLPQEALFHTLQKRVQEKIKDYNLMAEPYASDETRVSRRYALKAIAQFPILAYGLTALDKGSVKQLPRAEEILPLCAAGIIACKNLYYNSLHENSEENIAAIIHVLKTYLPALEAFARQSSSKQQRPAAHLAAQGYLLATIIADHQRKLDHMEAYSREARLYGQLADDPNLEASALARLAVKFDYESRDRKALHVYQEAAALPSFEQVSPLLRGRIYAGLAGTNAYVQQKDDSQNFLGRAKDIFPEKPEDDPSFYFAYSANDTIVLWEGLARKYLGQHVEAFHAFSFAEKLQPGTMQLLGLSEHNQAEFLNYTASVAVKQKQLDVSYLYTEAAEEIAWTIKHEQRYAEVLETVRSMGILWPQEPLVKQIQEKIQARQV